MDDEDICIYVRSLAIRIKAFWARPPLTSELITGFSRCGHRNLSRGTFYKAKQKSLVVNFFLVEETWVSQRLGTITYVAKRMKPVEFLLNAFV